MPVARFAHTAAVLVLGVAAARAQLLPEGPEPNASPAQATVLPFGHEAFGVLGAVTDSDWYRVVLAVPADLRVETGPGVGTEVGDTVLVLLDATGAPLRANQQGVGCGLYARLYVPTLPAGTYYVAVEGGPAAVAGGGYVLDVRAAAPVALPVPPLVAESPENNDPRTGGTATTIVLPARCNGTAPSVGAAGDHDFYRFTLTAESLVQARVAATAVHPTTPRLDDPVLWLFDASSPPNVLAGPFRATAFGAWDATFDLVLPPGSYHVAIRGWLDSIAGSYWLDLHRTDAARVTVWPGGCGGRVAAVATTAVGPGAPATTERPVLGTTYAVRGSNLGAGGFVFHVVGFAPTFLDLTPFGAPGCVLEVVHVDTPLQLADAAGRTTFIVPIPDSAAFAGLSLESQLAVFDLSNPLGLTLSNRVSARLGP